MDKYQLKICEGYTVEVDDIENFSLSSVKVPKEYANLIEEPKLDEPLLNMRLCLTNG